MDSDARVEVGAHGVKTTDGRRDRRPMANGGAQARTSRSSCALGSPWIRRTARTTVRLARGSAVRVDDAAPQRRRPSHASSQGGRHQKDAQRCPRTNSSQRRSLADDRDLLDRTIRATDHVLDVVVTGELSPVLDRLWFRCGAPANLDRRFAAWPTSRPARHRTNAIGRSPAALAAGPTALSKSPGRVGLKP